MKRFLIPITFPKGKGTKAKAWVQDNGGPWMYVEAKSAAAAAREVAARVRPQDERPIRFAADVKDWNLDQPAVVDNKTYSSYWVYNNLSRYRHYLWQSKPGCCGTAWEGEQLEAKRIQLEQHWARMIEEAKGRRETWIARQLEVA